MTTVPVGWHRWSARDRAVWRARHARAGVRVGGQLGRGPAVVRAVELLAAGLSRRRVAELTGLSRYAVGRLARGEPAWRRASVVVPGVECLEMTDRGMSCVEIARILTVRAGRPVKPSRVADAVRGARAARERR